MSGMDILRALSGIDDEFIQEAACLDAAGRAPARQHRLRLSRRWAGAALAACLCLAVGLTLWQGGAAGELMGGPPCAPEGSYAAAEDCAPQEPGAAPETEAPAEGGYEREPQKSKDEALTAWLSVGDRDGAETLELDEALLEAFTAELARAEPVEPPKLRATAWLHLQGTDGSVTTVGLLPEGYLVTEGERGERFLHSDGPATRELYGLAEELLPEADPKPKASENG